MGLSVKGFWKPPPAFRLGTPESALPSTSLSSSPPTFLALFFLGALRFLVTLARSPPPRVERDRAKLFSCACSCAASRASASSDDAERFTFFLAGSGEADGSVSPFSDTPLVAGRLLLAWLGPEEAATALRSAPETASKRASMSFLMASWTGLAWQAGGPARPSHLHDLPTVTAPFARSNRGRRGMPPGPGGPFCARWSRDRRLQVCRR